MDRVFELMEEKYDIKDKEDANTLPPIEGEVEFDNVRFPYEEDGETVLKDVNFTSESRRNSSIRRDEWRWEIDNC